LENLGVSLRYAKANKINVTGKKRPIIVSQQPLMKDVSFTMVAESPDLEQKPDTCLKIPKKRKTAYNLLV
jgi:hypothetical protein